MGSLKNSRPKNNGVKDWGGKCHVFSGVIDWCLGASCSLLWNSFSRTRLAAEESVLDLLEM